MIQPTFFSQNLKSGSQVQNSRNFDANLDCKSFTTEAAKKPEEKVKVKRKKSAYKGTNGRILTGVRRQYTGSVKSPTSVMSYPANQNNK